MNWIKPLHKWLSLLVGVQLLIWLGTGLYFNLADHQAASGNALRQSVDTETVRPVLSLVPVSQLPVNRVEQIKLHWIHSQPYYQAIHQSQPHARQRQQSSLYSATTGLRVSLSDRQLTDIALASYTGTAEMEQARRLTPPVDDLPGNQNPVWQVIMDDDAGTAIYVNPANGRVIKHMNDDSRLWDFMLMLHFMDYTDTGGFNHSLIIIVALSTLLLAVSGVIWLVERLRNLGFTFPWQRESRSLTVLGPGGSLLNTGPFNDADTLHDGLAGQHIALPSSCGGGGSCGLCRVGLSSEVGVTAAERALLSDEDIESGTRLACQHKCREVDGVEIDRISSGAEHTMTLVDTEFVTPFIKRLSFYLNEEPCLSLAPGAHMPFFIPEGMHNSYPDDIPEKFARYWQDQNGQVVKRAAAVRHYSIANYDPQRHRLTFFVRWQQPSGVGSGYLGSLRPGDEVKVSEPVSEFLMPEGSRKKKVFVGGGSGISPLYAMIMSLASQSAPPPAVFFYGARSELDLACKAELQTLSDSSGWFDYRPVLSRASEHWRGETGYVQGPLERYLQEHGAMDTEFYLCGPEAMMIEVRELLLKFGVANEAVLQDDFSVNKRSEVHE
ncbi:Na(+)-translocating NADH-quinone reductase subunit [Saliniradius amylolyticus]|uniref:Na(+)-translocating NADH-quinone reductase subunit n=1 Tax=Saliniradius amylolyticus TaxID=2183582 RepID=A0A2S2E5S0_9ALTE|nr:PepSY domain-containing protein [Saliniradius amylolyticus]AWL12307.1 Na(+)-translocating NADH-quinone reductase subunit [Saliniradius amylolyticus]